MPSSLVERHAGSTSDRAESAQRASELRQPALEEPLAPAPAASARAPARRPRAPRPCARAAGTGRRAPRAPGGSRPARRARAVRRRARDRPPGRRASPRPPRDSARRPAMAPGAAARRTARRSRRQSVAPASGACACTAAIAACSVYGPKRRAASARSTSAVPSAICARFQSERSWSSSSTSSPDRRGPRGAARIVQQHQRQQPDRFGLRQQLDQQPAQPDRLARRDRAGSATRPNGRVALVEDEVDDAQHGSSRSGSSAGAGTS